MSGTGSPWKSAIKHWTSGVYEESLTFITMILSEMLTFII